MAQTSSRRRAVWASVFAMLALPSLSAKAADLYAPPPAPTFVAPALPYPDAGRFTIIEENDALGLPGSDRHYTQGAMFSYLSPLLSGQDLASRFMTATSNVLPIFQGGPGVQRKFDVVFGQSIFTPVRFREFPLDPKDRPFAGWLYTGGSLLQETNGRMLENLELLIGVVGPDSLADITQQGFHDLIGFDNKQLSQTWKTQLRNEPGVALTYERKYKLWQSTLFGFETDAIPEAGITAGNVFTYGSVGGQVRLGRDLGVDYGIPRVRPSLSGTSWFDPKGLTYPWGWYVFAGLQGRAVAQNIFLDGNTFVDSRHVDKEILVGDASVGGSVFYKDLVKFDVTFSIRSKEFTTQTSPDRYGTVSVSFRF